MTNFILERYNEIPRLCIINVKERIKQHNSAIMNKNWFYKDKLMNYTDMHIYHANLSSSFESRARSKIVLLGRFIVPLQIYYIKQEKDFNTWYNNSDNNQCNVMWYHSKVLESCYEKARTMLIDEHYKYWLVKHFNNLDVDIIFYYK